MDEMLSGAALPRAVELYCADGSAESDRAQGLNTLLVQVHRKETTLQDLLAGTLRPYLTSEESAVRLRSTRLLALLLRRLPELKLEPNVQAALARFFCDRFRSDLDSAPGCLAGLAALIEIHRLQDAATALEVALTAHHVPALTQGLRMAALQVVAAAVPEEGEAVIAVDGRTLAMLCDALEGEKDPRCLLLGLRLVARVLGAARFSSDAEEERLVQRAFEVTCVYFPIVFRPPPNDPFRISPEQLWDALHAVFAGHPLMAAPVVGMLLEKLGLPGPELAPAKIDSLRTLRKVLPAYGPFELPRLRAAFASLVVSAEDAELVREACRAAGAVTALLAKQREAIDTEGGGGDWSAFVEVLVSDAAVAVKGSVDSMVGRNSARLLAAVAGSSALGLASVARSTLPLVRMWCVRPDATESQRGAALELLDSLVSAIDAEVDHQPRPLTAEQVADIFELLMDQLSAPHFEVADAPAGDGAPPARRPRAASVPGMGAVRSATEALVKLITRPPTPLLSDEQVRGAIATWAGLLERSKSASPETQYVRDVCLEALVAVGKASDAGATAVAALPQIAVLDLDVLAALCAVGKVFDAAMPHMLSRGADEALLGRLADIVEANSSHASGIRSCCLPLPEALGASENLTLLPALLALLSTGAVAPSAGARRLVRTLAQFADEETQRALVGFAEAKLVPPDAGAPSEGACVAGACVLGAVPAEALAALDGPAEVDRLGRLALGGYPAAAEAAAALLNKCCPDAGESLEKACLEGVAPSRPAADRLEALGVLSWVLKAKAMRGKGQALTKAVLGLIGDADATIAMSAAEALGNVLRPCDGPLSKACHAREGLLFRQRFFAANLQVLREQLKSDEENRVARLLAAARLVEFVPRAVLLQDAGAILPFLSQALAEAELRVATSAMASLAVLVEADLEATEPFLQSLVPRTLELTRYRPGLAARHRVLALDCLLAFAALPYNKLHALRPTVTRKLQEALDDPKRPVRRRAVECRNTWLTLHNV